MATMAFGKPVYFRVIPKTKRALESALFKLRGHQDVTWLYREPTQEAVLNALCLFLDDLPADDLVAIFREYLPKLEGLMRADQMAVKKETPPSAPEVGQHLATLDTTDAFEARSGRSGGRRRRDRRRGREVNCGRDRPRRTGRQGTRPSRPVPRCYAVATPPRSSTGGRCPPPDHRRDSDASSSPTAVSVVAPRRPPGRGHRLCPPWIVYPWTVARAGSGVNQGTKTHRANSLRRDGHGVLMRRDGRSVRSSASGRPPPSAGPSGSGCRGWPCRRAWTRPHPCP